MKDELEELRSVLDPLMEGKKSLKILEAGCGSRTSIRLPPDAYIVGVDISEEQLRKNTGLQEKRVGDIQTCDLGEHCFDVIVCWDVLEHLKRPLDAVSNFFRAIKEDGTIILAFPNVMSIRGLVTKFTPHLFHVWFYRYLWRQKTIGEKGYYSPFRTYLRFAISPDSLRKYAARHGFATAYCRLYQGVMQRQTRRRNTGIDRLFQVAEPLLKVLTLGSLRVRESDVIMVFRKEKMGCRSPDTASAPVSHPSGGRFCSGGVAAARPRDISESTPKRLSFLNKRYRRIPTR